jgi:hypothetical protein
MMPLLLVFQQRRRHLRNISPRPQLTSLNIIRLLNMAIQPVFIRVAVDYVWEDEVAAAGVAGGIIE